MATVNWAPILKSGHWYVIRDVRSEIEPRIGPYANKAAASLHCRKNEKTRFWCGLSWHTEDVVTITSQITVRK